MQTNPRQKDDRDGPDGPDHRDVRHDRHDRYDRQDLEDAAPGSGSVFALRVIGVLLAVRWVQAMVDTGFAAVLNDIGSSPIAILHLVYIALLVALPGARPGPAHPYQPLPRWLRQLLRAFSLLGFFFSLWAILPFAAEAGVDQMVAAVKASNGWLVAAPLLYLGASWLCRRRALWRTRTTAGRFAIGWMAIALDGESRTATVWDQNRQIGQYAVGELTLRQRRRWLASDIELIWTSLAAAGHNRKRVFRIRSLSAADRNSALALDTALRRFQ